MVRSTLMPIRPAAFGSWAVARMALPWRVFLTNQVRPDQQRDGHGGDEQLLVGDGDRRISPSTVVQDVLVRDHVLEALDRRALPEQADVLEHEAHADRRDQRRDLRRVAERPIGESFDRHVEQGRRAHHEHQDPEDHGRRP